MALPQGYQWYLDEGTGDDGLGTGGSQGLPKLELRMRVPTGGWELSLTDGNGTNTVTVPAGDYYLNTIAPGGTSSLLAELAAQLSDGSLTYTVVADDDTELSTGKVTIQVSAGNFSITWGDDELRDRLGFTGASTSSAPSATGANHARYLFLPNTGRKADTPDPAEDEATQDFGAAEADYVVTRSPGGVTTQTVFSIRRLDRMAFEPLLGYKTWLTNETIRNESWERFWLDALAEEGGAPFRYHRDRSVDAVKHTLCGAEDFAQLKPARMVDGWVGPLSHWHLEFGVYKYEAQLVDGITE